jgi:hypothetical protein
MRPSALVELGLPLANVALVELDPRRAAVAVDADDEAHDA